MNYYLIGSEEGFNELRFPNVMDWQRYMGFGKSIFNEWNPVELEYIYGNKNKRNKNFDLSQSCDPLFTISEKALCILENMLVKNGEILNISSPKGFYFFHCTNVLDALKEDESEIIWLDKEKKWVSSINKFVLDKEKIKDNSIFRLPNANYRYTFWGEDFKNLVITNKLRGIHFNRYEIII